MPVWYNIAIKLVTLLLSNIILPIAARWICTYTQVDALSTRNIVERTAPLPPKIKDCQGVKPCTLAKVATI